MRDARGWRTRQIFKSIYILQLVKHYTSLKKYFFNQLEDVKIWRVRHPLASRIGTKKFPSKYKKYVQILQLSEDFENKFYRKCIVKLSEINVL